MKMYVHSGAASPCRSFVAEGVFHLGVVMDDSTCQAKQYASVEFPERPDDVFHRAVATKVDGVWVGAWEEITHEQLDDEVVAAKVRKVRDARLAESDWTQVADAPVDKDAWALHRQALRDITDQPGFPHDVVWPPYP